MVKGELAQQLWGVRFWSIQDTDVLSALVYECVPPTYIALGIHFSSV